METIGNFFKNFWKSIIDFFSLHGETMLQNTIIALVTLVVGHYLIKVIIMFMRRLFNIRKRQVDRSYKTFLISFVNITLRLCLFIGILMILNIPLNSFISILSAGVLAIGLSLQDSIGNFASGVMLLSTKPFVTGDFVELGNGISGTIAEIRMMSTAIDSSNNQRVVVPNSKVMRDTIINYSAHPTRRIDLTVSISFDSDVAKAKKVIMDILKKDDKVLSAPSPVVMLRNIGSSGLEIGIRVFTPTSSYWNTIWNLNEMIILAFRKNSISIPLNQLAVTLAEKNDANIID